MSNPNSTVALWQQLQGTAQVLQTVVCGGSATAALDNVNPALRPGVQALVFDVLRTLGLARAIRAQLCQRKPSARVDALLCSALALASMRPASYDAHTLVNQATEAAKRHPATKDQAGFINACLRRFLREQDALLATVGSDPAARWNYPPWWVAQIRLDWPEDWEAILLAGNRRPPMTLRVNSRKISRDAYQHLLQQAGHASVAVGESALLLKTPVPVQSLPGFTQGQISVQDAAAQMAAPILINGLPSNRRPRVLDACAAPGGKTAHLLELRDCELTALDVDRQRCDRIHETLGRLGLHATVVVADAAQPQSWWNGELFDAILLDAPCTASGIVRRHPDIRWLRRETDPDQLATVQASLLRALWRLLKPAGRLLYCTCSVFKIEGALQIETFLANNTDAALLPSPGHLIPRTGANSTTLPENRGNDHDGFYFALLEKCADPV